jgi:glyoxylase-like metal-dependent hydrolase (beta-lactamase superfamily II)
MSHREIDLCFQATGRAICSHVIDGWVVDPGPGSSLETLLDALGDELPSGVLLTHIHLDHAGGTGELLKHLGSLPVYVHERGARHLVDPSRLLASATRLYGDQMDALWGAIVPVPESCVRVLGEAELPAEFDWLPTPGHAVHHASYLHKDSGTAFCGDVAGIRVGDGPVFPPTPPPDINIEDWHRSVTAIRGWQPSALALTHFGTFTDVDRHLDELELQLDVFAELARELDEQAFEARVRGFMGGTSDEAGYLKAMPPETLYSGLSRYWAQRTD